MIIADVRRDRAVVHETQRSILTQVADAASPTSTRSPYDRRLRWRAMRTELRDVAQVDVVELRHRADDLARRIRELDQRIQVINFTSGLIGQ